MRAPYGARNLLVSAAQALAGSVLVGGPVRLLGWSLADSTAGQGQNVDQSAAAPAAGGQVAAITLANGVYNVSWTFELTGTPGAADVDNVRVTLGAAVLAVSVNPGAVGNYQQEEFQVTVTGGPVSLVWKAIGAAAVGTTYKVEANIIPVGNTQAQIFDGGMQIAISTMPQGSSDTQHLGGHGVRAQTNLSVLAANGTVNGSLWFELVYPDGDFTEVRPDLDDPVTPYGA